MLAADLYGFAKPENEIHIEAFSLKNCLQRHKTAGF